MQKTIFLFVSFCIGVFSSLSALVLKNDTCQTIQIVILADARGYTFQDAPDKLRPHEIIEIQNTLRSQPVCLQQLRMVMQTDVKKHAFFLSLPAKDLSRVYRGNKGLTLGVPQDVRDLRRHYRAQEKFPGQLNVRLESLKCMKKC